MRYHALACDYDGTLASNGRVEEETLHALRKVRDSGRRIVLVTGRLLPDLLELLDPVDLFDRIVAENGAVLYRPATREERQLADPPPAAFVQRLARLGVRPLAPGRVIVGTVRPHETVVLDAIRELGLELQVIFNREAVMVLPSGVNKGTGLRAALDELGLSLHNAVGVGDAENDHGFLELCECAVAVADALPALRERADLVTAGASTRGVAELAARLLRDDLAGVARRGLLLGRAADGTEVRVPAYGEHVLIAGTSGSGKSTLATGFLEQLRERDYQLCIVDPEGDYQTLEAAVTLGEAERPPTVREALQLLERPPLESVVLNLLGIALEQRPAFFDELLAALLELRGRTGRPHWLVVDEAHHLLPRDQPAPALLAQARQGVLLVTVHPEHVSPGMLATVGLVVAVGKAPEQTLASFAAARGLPAPAAPAGDLPAGEALAWRPSWPGAPVRFRGVPSRTERRRHRRKYADGELPPARSFYFRGPEGKLNLRAQNLKIFLQVGDGVDEATWLHHLRNGDVARWLRDEIKDPELAEAVAELARDHLSAAEGRARLRAWIEERYTESA